MQHPLNPKQQIPITVINKNQCRKYLREQNLSYNETEHKITEIWGKTKERKTTCNKFKNPNETKNNIIGHWKPKLARRLEDYIYIYYIIYIYERKQLWLKIDKNTTQGGPPTETPPDLNKEWLATQMGKPTSPSLALGSPTENAEDQT